MNTKELNKIINRGLTGGLFYIIYLALPSLTSTAELVAFIGLAIVTPYIISRINSILK